MAWPENERSRPDRMEPGSGRCFDRTHGEPAGLLRLQPRDHGNIQQLEPDRRQVSATTDLDANGLHHPRIRHRLSWYAENRDDGRFERPVRFPAFPKGPAGTLRGRLHSVVAVRAHAKLNRRAAGGVSFGCSPSQPNGASRRGYARNPGAVPELTESRAGFSRDRGAPVIESDFPGGRTVGRRGQSTGGGLSWREARRCQSQQESRQGLPAHHADVPPWWALPRGSSGWGGRVNGFVRATDRPSPGCRDELSEQGMRSLLPGVRAAYPFRRSPLPLPFRLGHGDDLFPVFRRGGACG